MDSASLFLTPNSDTVYFWSFVDLTHGPMVIDVPVMPERSAILGTIDDMWFRWGRTSVCPAPDRSGGGKYLLVGPGHDGPLPDSGFHVSHVPTTRACLIGRAFMVDNDPAAPVDAIRQDFGIYPYVPGAVGTAVASFLAGRHRLPWRRAGRASCAIWVTRRVEGVDQARDPLEPAHGGRHGPGGAGLRDWFDHGGSANRWIPGWSVRGTALAITSGQ